MTLQLKPSDIRYSQDSIKNTFNNGVGLRKTFEDIRDGSLSISAFPKISVAKVNGHWFTLDNRRLWLFRELEAVGKCDFISVHVKSSIPPGKMTTENDGVSIRVRNTYIPDDDDDDDDDDSSRYGYDPDDYYDSDDIDPDDYY